MYEPFSHLEPKQGALDDAALKNSFLAELEQTTEAEQIFSDVQNTFEGEELLEVCSEIARTINAECTADDFHNWNYDHLEFIIELSNRYNFVVPRNLLNGLPEQLIILVDSNKLGEPGCD